MCYLQMNNINIHSIDCFEFILRPKLHYYASVTFWKPTRILTSYKNELPHDSR